MAEKTFSTNDICKICNISRKKLLYYEEKGLLNNVIRDDNNNYRCYTERNIHDILLIKDLQRIGFSLNEILDLSLGDSLEGIKKIVKKRMVNAKDELSLSLAKYQQSSEKYMQLLEAVSVLKLEVNNKKNGYQIEPVFEITEFPGQHAIFIAFQGTFLDTEKMVYRKLSQLYNIADEFGITTLGSTISIYYDWFEKDCYAMNDDMHLIELYLPVNELYKTCPYYKKIESFRCVKTTHIGDYGDSLVNTYKKLFKWALEHNFKLANYSVEECLLGPLMTKNDKYWVVNVMIPIIDDVTK